MSTIDLGKIKMVWRGAYDNATAYTPDDVVSSGGSSYICILASTGNAVSNATYWSLLAQGGTDIGATLTTQGDILYRDGSGLQRLAPGTADQVLKTGGAGANPSWGTLSSDFVKVASTEVSSSVSSVTLKGFASSDYASYQCIITDLQKTGTTNTNWGFRWHINNSDVTSSNYRFSFNGAYFSNSGSATHHMSGAWDSNLLELTGWNSPDTRNSGYFGKYYRIEFPNLSNASLNKLIVFEHGNPHPAMNYTNIDNGFGYHNGSETRIAFGANDGFTIFPNADAIGIAKIKIYGRKA